MENKNNKSFIAGAIVVAAVIIGGAIVYTQKTPETKPVANVNQPTQEKNGKNLENPENLWDLINPISKNDHIMGDPSAELSLFLYFDINCGHCKNFHETLTKFTKENNKLKVIPRHFPLNPISQREAEATECVAEIGGEEKFAQYLDDLMANSIQSKDMADLEAQLINRTEKIGVDKESFKQCLTEERYKEKVTQTKEEAISLGIQGTPFSIITDSKGEIEKVIALPGALEYEDLKQLIESKLNE